MGFSVQNKSYKVKVIEDHGQSIYDTSNDGKTSKAYGING